jgi:hypothetical protein
MALAMRLEELGGLSFPGIFGQGEDGGLPPAAAAELREKLCPARGIDVRTHVTHA